MKNRVIIAMTVLVFCLALAGCGSKKINLMDYVTVEFSGINGYATATYNVDYDALVADMGVTEGLDENNIDQLAEIMKAESFIYDITYSLDKSSGLSNGDEVVVSASWDEETASSYKLKLTGDSMSVEVADLEEAKEIDLFADLSVEFTGTSPDVSVTITNNSKDEYISSIYYYADQTSGLSLNDTITVTASIDAEYAAEDGYKVSEVSKEYTVADVDTYITAFSDVDEDLLTKVKSQAEDVIESYLAGYNYYITYSDLTYVGSYFLSAKSYDYWSDYNKLIPVYSVTVNDIEYGTSQTIYLPVEFANVVKYSTGSTYVDLLDYEILGSYQTDFYAGWDQLYGYRLGDNMYNDIIVQNKANNTYEVTDDLKTFGN